MVKNLLCLQTSQQIRNHTTAAAEEDEAIAYQHTPVMSQEVLSMMKPKDGQVLLTVHTLISYW